MSRMISLRYKEPPSAYIGGQSSSPREPCLVRGTGRRQADCALGGLVRISAYSWSYTICFFLQFWSQTYFCLYYEYSSHIWFLYHNHNHISVSSLQSGSMKTKLSLPVKTQISPCLKTWPSLIWGYTHRKKKPQSLFWANGRTITLASPMTKDLDQSITAIVKYHAVTHHPWTASWEATCLVHIKNAYSWAPAQTHSVQMCI